MSAGACGCRLEADASGTGSGTKRTTVGVFEYRLTAVPTRTRAVWQAADAVRAALDERDEDIARRQVIQLADDLAREPDAHRVALSVTRPASTGSRRFDARVAGVTALRLRGLPLPGWVDDPWYRLDDDWDVEPLDELHPAARRATPREIARHGVYVDEREFESL